MDGIMVPFLPTGLWVLAGGLTILVLLIFLGNLIYCQRRSKREIKIKEDEEKTKLEIRKQYLKADIEALREYIQEQKIELERLAVQREEQRLLEARLNDLDQQYQNKELEVQSLRKDSGELENDLHIISERVEKLKKEEVGLDQRCKDLKEKFEKEKEDADQKRKELDELEKKVEEANSILQEAAKAQILNGELLAAKIGLKLKIEELKSDYEKHTKKTEEQIQTAEQAQKDGANLTEKVTELKNEIGLLRSEMQTLKEEKRDLESDKDSIKDQIDSLKQEKDNLEQRIKELEENKPELEEEIKIQHSKLTKIRDNIASELIQLTTLRSEIGQLRNERPKLEARHEFLKKEIENYDRKDADGSHDDLLKRFPRCLDRSLLPEHPFPYNGEEQALAEIHARLDEAEYHFHERVIKAFHTSLKCHDINPLTVLSGVSGTGKTLLPRAYARLMGMHSLVIPVQPRWDSPQDMFGFYNYYEKRYRATELACALIRMDPFTTAPGLDEKQKCKDKMLLVLMDEMNLARTEYYFSEFLSKLELGRDSGSLHIKSNQQHSEIYLDTGPARKAIYFLVGSNVLFTGTMNVDESTQTLSDKVLDRANVLRFGRPVSWKLEDIQAEHDNQLPEALGYLKSSQWLNWHREIQTSSWTGKAIEWINDLNDALAKVGRPFGHRVVKNIITYVCNYPGVDSNDSLFKDAFSDQIEQKILPKLRGLDTIEGVNNAAFDDIEKIVAATGDDALHKAYKQARTNTSVGMFLWQGVTR